MQASLRSIALTSDHNVGKSQAKGLIPCQKQRPNKSLHRTYPGCISKNLHDGSFRKTTAMRKHILPGTELLHTWPRRAALRRTLKMQFQFSVQNFYCAIWSVAKEFKHKLIYQCTAQVIGPTKPIRPNLPCMLSS
jgi:hypothetical protein